MELRRLLFALSAVACASALTGCSSAGGGSTQATMARDADQPIVKQQDVDQSLVSAMNRFGYRLLTQLAHESPKGNVFISPSSMHTALSMVYNGATGDTKEEMARVLGLDGLDLARVNTGFEKLTGALTQQDPGVELRVANSVWTARNLTVEPDFTKAMRTAFGAEQHDLSEGPDAINEWASRNTNGKIPKVIDSISPDIVMILANATYFKGAWTDEFYEKATKTAVFHAPDGPADARLMNRQGEMQYKRAPGYQMVRLPYGDGRFAMRVILPSEGTTPLQLCDKLMKRGWEELNADLISTKVDLALPKFKLEWGQGLNETLQAMGMKRAFSPSQAEFGSISKSGPIWIGEAMQKTFVEVNEKGTEAAAVSTVLVAGCSAGPSSVQVMRVDRPFLCLIEDSATKTVVFIGIINRPTD